MNPRRSSHASIAIVSPKHNWLCVEAPIEGDVVRVDKAAMLGYVTLYNDDGDEEEVSFPVKFEVCGGCNGKGTHVNRAIDSHGISPEEFAEDPSFQEAYFSGVYDVTCEDCGGDRVMPYIDDDACKKLGEEKMAELTRYQDKLDDDASYDRMCEMERRMGA